MKKVSSNDAKLKEVEDEDDYIEDADYWLLGGGTIAPPHMDI